MSDRPSPEDVIDGLECGWCTTSLYGGSIVSALHDAGFKIVTADDAAKLDRLRECSRTVSDGGGYGDGWNDLLDKLRGDSE